jgi:acid phosphatase family membrane protein YuiD
MKFNFIILFQQFFPIIAALLAMFIAQFLKMFVGYFKKEGINMRRFISAGGMPSSHSALVTGLTASIALTEGISSNQFFICLVFSIIVVYDAAGIRRAVGKHANILNTIIDEYYAKGELRAQPLTELLGHTWFEVFMGILLGIITARILFNFI